MARKAKGLSATMVKSEKLAPGLHADGGGLYLQVSKWHTKSWIFRYTFNGSRRGMGLGAYADVSLKEAREKAAEKRAMVANNVDPIEARKREKARAAIERGKRITFKQAAENYINSKEAEWGNGKHRDQWRNTLEAHAFPVIGDLPVGDIETAQVMKVLEPIWSTKTETATRVRGRIEAVLDSAKVQGLRDGENPARWRGHLDKILARPSRVKKVNHHNALPYVELGAFMVDLREREAVAARALEFAILSAARTGEVIGAKWPEIDFQTRVWTIPGDRMKAGKEHRVPLSDRTMAVLSDLHDKRASDGGFVFPGQRGGGLSNMAMLKLLQDSKRMGRSSITVHGFRSTFRDWAAETTAYPNHVVEMALAHSIGNGVEAAYRRGDLFEKRRRLMDDWADYCGAMPVEDEAGKVVVLHSQS